MDIYTENGKKSLIKQYSPKTKLFKNSILSFIFGGTIALIGEGLRRLYIYLGALPKTALTLVSVTLIVTAAILTAFGIFDKIARHAGAGTLVPITGFSNAVTSQAIDAKSEGVILGIGSKIFTVAGPVILFGITAGAAYGLIYYLTIFFMSMT